MNFYTIRWENGTVRMIDQRKLPAEEIYRSYATAEAVGEAIREMVIRGAPAIGVAGAFGMALAAQNCRASDFASFQKALDGAAEMLIRQRPTAVNLPWAVRRIQGVYRGCSDQSPAELKKRILDEALRIYEEDVTMCRQMGEHGAALIEEGKTYLTHCNAGALATAGQGTALSVFYEAAKQGKKFRVVASETRPFLQGARLTCWELMKNNIEVTLITDNMVAHLMKQGMIQGVFTGSDRIVANGDVANKIGTYGVALMAKEHGIPFYVVAPSSTVDLESSHGDQIPIEQRPGEEVTHFLGKPSAPAGIQVLNPAFDVTPHPLVKAIITERGIAQIPFQESLKKLMAS